jgi:hypothetical protein
MALLEMYTIYIENVSTAKAQPCRKLFSSPFFFISSSEERKALRMNDYEMFLYDKKGLSFLVKPERRKHKAKKYSR